MVKPHQTNTKAMDFSAFHSNAHKTQLKSDVARRLFRIRFSFAVARSLVPVVLDINLMHINFPHWLENGKNVIFQSGNFDQTGILHKILKKSEKLLVRKGENHGIVPYFKTYDL